MTYTQLTAMYQGFNGGPGWTRMKFDSDLSGAAADAAAGNFRSLLSALSTTMPTGSSYSFDPVVTVHHVSGTLEKEFSLGTLPEPVNGTSSSSYAAGSGAVVFWLTGFISSGSKIKGRTYFVPLTSGAFQADGTLATVIRDSLQSAAASFAASTPRPVVVSHLKRDGGVVDIQATMSGANVPDRSAILRSRRG